MESQITLLQMMTLLHLVEKYGIFFFSTSLVALVADLSNISNINQELVYYVKNGLIEYIGEDIYI